MQYLRRNLRIRTLILLFVSLGILMLPKQLLAGAATDRLSVCLVESTSEIDELSLLRWILVVFAAHPAVSDISNVSESTKTILDVEVAKIFERLMVKDCNDEVKTALIVDGQSALESAFTILGQVAGVGLAKDPLVIERMEGFLQYVNPKSFEKFRQ